MQAYLPSVLNKKKCWFCKNTTELIFQCKVKYVNKWPKIAPFCAPNSNFFWGGGGGGPPPPPRWRGGGAG